MKIERRNLFAQFAILVTMPVVLAGCGGGGGGGSTSGQGTQGYATVTGRLVDKANGAPLAARTVTVQGTNILFVTGSDGRFTLSNVADGSVKLAITDSVKNSDGTVNEMISGSSQDLGDISIDTSSNPPAPPPIYRRLNN